MGGPTKVYPQSRGLHTSLSHLYPPTPILEAGKLRLACPSSASQSVTGLQSGLPALFA